MSCYYKDGMTMCGDLGPHCADHRCAWAAEYLCDYPVGNGKTCDRPLCSDHAYEVAPDIHYCAQHYSEFEKFKQAGGIKKELENVVPYKQSEETSKC